jgi:hypothetical protein
MKNILIKEIVTEDTLVKNLSRNLRLIITHKNGFAVNGGICFNSYSKPIALSNFQAVEMMDRFKAENDRVEIYGQPITGILA